MLSDKIKTFMAEIRDLKTAQTIPSTIQAYRASYTLGPIPGAPETASLTITYEPGDGEPITMIDFEFYAGIYLLPFDAATQTQTIFIDNQSITSAGLPDPIEVTSNRPIVDIA